MRTGGSTRRRAAPWLLAPLATLLVAGCSSLPEMDWNPLIRVEHTPDGAVEIEALGPLINIRSGPEGVSHALRPLYQHKANFGYPITDFLAPFGKRFATADGSRWRFWPIIWSGKTRESTEGTEWDAVLFPFIFAGNGPRDDDGYFAIFPLGGRMRNLFGIDTFDFFLWPFFMRTHMNVTERSTSWTVLLLGGWTTGGPRDGSWRILPFYRHRIVHHVDGTLRTDQQTVLWPFFTWGLDHGDTSDPSYRTTFWPFYGYEAGEHWSRLTVLWPFFRFNSETQEAGGDYLYDLPWPLVRHSADAKRKVVRYFPFYSRQQTENLDSMTILFLYWDRASKGRTMDEGWPPRSYKRQDTYMFPFWHNSHRTVSGRSGADTQYQFWPLWHRDATVRGRRDTAIFSLMPTRNWEFLKPADELYSFLWTLWRYRSDGTRHETRWLFDTTLYRESPEGVRISVPFLYSQRPESNGRSKHQILWGLLGFGTDPDGLADVSMAGWTLWRR